MVEESSHVCMEAGLGCVWNLLEVWSEHEYFPAVSVRGAVFAVFSAAWGTQPALLWFPPRSPGPRNVEVRAKPMVSLLQVLRDLQKGYECLGLNLGGSGNATLPTIARDPPKVYIEWKTKDE